MARPKKEQIVETQEELVEPTEPVVELDVDAVQMASSFEEKPDLSRLDEEGKILSLQNLLRQMPPQYLTEEKLKESIWSIARFVPTDEQIKKARDLNFKPVPRFPN